MHVANEPTNWCLATSSLTKHPQVVVDILASQELHHGFGSENRNTPRGVCVYMITKKKISSVTTYNLTKIVHLQLGWPLCSPCSKSPISKACCEKLFCNWPKRQNQLCAIFFLTQKNKKKFCVIFCFCWWNCK